MTVKVYVYSYNGYGEYVLPEQKEQSFCLDITKNKFKISTDVEIVLSQVSGTWSFVKSSKYIIYQNDSPYLGENIQINKLYKIELLNKESLYLFAVEVESCIKEYIKYDITGLNQLTIGSLASNIIQFQNLALISRKHIKLEKFNKGIIVEDLSSNGVFVNGKREDGRKYVEFGSHIHIYGLDIIYLGDIIAIAVIDCESFEVKKTGPLPAWPVPRDAPAECRASPRRLLSVPWTRSPFRRGCDFSAHRLPADPCSPVRSAW